MNDWQNYLVLGLVGWAAAYLVRRVWLHGKSQRASASCGGCAGCSAQPADGVSKKSIGTPLPSSIVQIKLNESA